jgi:PKD repeat protein
MKIRYNYLLLFTLLCWTTFFTNAQTTITIGTGTGTFGGTAAPTPYGAYFTSSRVQYLILASELNAAGLTTSTNLNSIAFNVSALGTGGQTCPSVGMHLEFTIKMKNTTITAVPTTFDNSGLTTVVNPMSYLQNITGWNLHNFDVPFLWDGTSNVLVDLCHNNSTGGATCYSNSPTYFYSVTPFVSATHTWADGSGSLCGAASGTTTGNLSNRPNMQFQYMNTTPPVTIPPIASFAYDDRDTVWINSPRTIVNTSNQATSSYWDITGYNATNKYGIYSSINLPRQLKNTEGFNDYFLDTNVNKTNLDRYLFDAPGYYKVKLVALNGFGFDTYYDTLYVDTPSSPPVAEFFADRRLIGVYDFTSMFDLSSNGPTSWFWYMNPPYYDPNIQYPNEFTPTKYLQNPSLSANEGGLFDVCLVATNDRGSDTICKSDYLRIISGYQVCRGSSTLEDTVATELEGSAKLYTVSEQYVPSLIGACDKGFTIAPCTDTVTLFVDRMRLRDADSLRIRIGGKTGPIIGRYGGHTVPAAFLTLKVPGGVAFLETDLDNYTGAGDSGYVVRWTANPATYPAPAASFSIPDTIYDGYAVQYNNTSVGNKMTFAWDTDGDGNFGLDNQSDIDSTTTSPTRTFAVFTPYIANICLRARNCKGTNIACKQVQFLPVNAAPFADFAVDRLSGFTTDTFRFVDMSSNGPNQWKWRFSPNNVAYLNGTDSTSQNPIVFLNSAINYTITLIATNAMGSNTRTKTSYVTAIAFGSPGCSGCPAPGGIPIIPSTMDIGITRVTLANMDTTTQLNTPIYHALYNQKIATLYRGVTYTLTTSRGSANDPMSTRAWIDFNHNTNFGDIPIETIISENNQNKTITTGTFTVPGNTIIGNTRLRVGITYGSTDISYQVSSLGCFEEYGIQIGVDYNKPVLALIGNSLEKVEVNKPYTEKGVIAIDLLEGDISSRYHVTGAVDITKVGYYTLKYTVADLYGNVSDTVIRTVQVEVNQTGPTLILNGPDTMIIEAHNVYNDPGAVATSNTGTDLSGLITLTGTVDIHHLGTYPVVYTIKDQFGFSANKTRIVIINDVTAPVIITNAGTPTITHQVGTPYLDPITITDNYWTNVGFVRTGTINPNLPGIYNLTYNATDGSGNVATTYNVIVTVKDLIPPVVVLNGSNPMIVDVFTTFNDPGVTKSDNFYPSLIVVTTGLPKMNQLGQDTVTYTVTDGAGNTTVVQRIVIKVDQIAPEIELLGQNPLEVCRFTTYTEAGAKINDNYYSSQTLQTSMTVDMSQLNLSLPGYYFITYNVTDPSGNKAQPQQRLIKVVECPFLGMDELNGNSNMMVYPNPNNGIFTVSTKNNTNITSIKVMDVVGKVVYTQSVKTSGTQVDISNMNKGLYMIVLEDDNSKTYSGKIVVE